MTTKSYIKKPNVKNVLSKNECFTCFVNLIESTSGGSARGATSSIPGKKTANFIVRFISQNSGLLIHSNEYIQIERIPQ